MGNCIQLQRPVSWVDDDEDEYWESKARSEKHQEQGEEEGYGKQTASREIRIKISKKQLEELLRQVDGEGLPLRHVLAGLAGVRRNAGKLQPLLHEHERHWRPNLQSIPEVAEYVFS